MTIFRLTLFTAETGLQGKLWQINHYYPLRQTQDSAYGMRMAMGHGKKYKNMYTGKELQTGEYWKASVSTGLEMYDYSLSLFAFKGARETASLSFEARFFDPQLGRWIVPDPVQQFSNPYIGMANNPARFTDLTGTTAVDADTEGGGGGANSNDDDDDEEEEPEGDPGDGIVLGWDGGYHGGSIGVPPFRASTFFSGRTLHYGQISWLNDIGAINGSFAPVMRNGKLMYYNAKKGSFGYWVNSARTTGEWEKMTRKSEEGSDIDISSFSQVSETISTWVRLESEQGEGKFLNSKAALNLGGIVYGAGQHIVSGMNYWLGEYGKYSFKMTGKGPNGWTGSRIGALEASRVFKIAGRSTFYLGAFIGGYKGIEKLKSGNYLGASKSGLDITMGAISTYGSLPGPMIGTLYFATDGVMSLYTNRLKSDPSFLKSEFSRAIGSDPRFGGIK